MGSTDPNDISKNLRKSSKKRRAKKNQENQDKAIELMSVAVPGKTFLSEDAAALKI